MQCFFLSSILQLMHFVFVCKFLLLRCVSTRFLHCVERWCFSQCFASGCKMDGIQTRRHPHGIISFVHFPVSKMNLYEWTATRRRGHSCVRKTLHKNVEIIVVRVRCSDTGRFGPCSSGVQFKHFSLVWCVENPIAERASLCRKVKANNANKWPVG